MNRVVRGPNELKNCSSILTRRGGTDANAPESPRKAILRDWHVGILAPLILKNIPQMIPITMKIAFHGTRVGRNEQQMPLSG